jgi:hypothetical protein
MRWCSSCAQLSTQISAADARRDRRIVVTDCRVALVWRRRRGCLGAKELAQDRSEKEARAGAMTNAREEHGQLLLGDAKAMGAREPRDLLLLCSALPVALRWPSVVPNVFRPAIRAILRDQVHASRGQVGIQPITVHACCWRLRVLPGHGGGPNKAGGGYAKWQLIRCVRYSVAEGLACTG